jgi:hypothetical protein
VASGFPKERKKEINKKNKIHEQFLSQILKQTTK